MKSKKILCFLLVFALVIAMLGATLVACNNESGKPAGGENSGENDDNENNGENGNSDDPVVPTDLNVEEVKTAVGSVIKALYPYFEGPMLDEFEYEYEYLMNMYDEVWEIAVSKLEVAGVTIEQINTLCEKAIPVVCKFYEVYLYISNGPSADDGTGSSSQDIDFTEYMKSAYGVEEIQDILDLLNYAANNLRAKQFLAVAETLEALTEYPFAPNFAVNEINNGGKDYTTEEIKQMFEDAGYLEEFNNYYYSEYGYDSIIAKFFGIASEKETLELIDKLFKTVLTLNGLTAEEIKNVADIVFVYIGAASTNGNVSPLYYSLAEISSSEMKAAIDSATKLISGLINEDTEDVLVSVLEKLVALGSDYLGVEFSGEFVKDYLPLIKSALPEIVPLLQSVEESDIQEILAANDQMIATQGSEIAYQRLSLTFFEKLGVYYNKLSAGTKQCIVNLLGEDYLGNILSKITKPVRTMTDEECDKVFNEVAEIINGSGNNNVYETTVTTQMLIEKGSSAEDVYNEIFKEYQSSLSYNLPRDFADVQMTVDTSEVAYVPATVNFTSEQGVNVVYNFYVRIYDDNFVNEIKVSESNALEVLNIYKGTEITEGKLLQLFTNNIRIYNVSFYDTVSKSMMNFRDWTVESVTENVDTSKTGVTAAVATLKHYIAGEVKIPFLYCVWDIDTPARINGYYPAIVVEGNYPDIRVEESYDIGLPIGLPTGKITEIPVSDINGFDPNKIGVQVYSYVFKGKTYKAVTKVVSQKEANNSFKLNFDTDYEYCEPDSLESADELVLRGSFMIFNSYSSFNNFGELKEDLEEYGYQVSWDVDQSKLDEEQDTIIKVTDTKGNVVFDTSIIYYISSAYLPVER